jgi:hypothetical protein
MHGVLSDLATAPDRLRAAEHSADAEATNMVLHTLRGQALTMGADLLARALAAAEKRLRAPETTGATAEVIAPALSAIEDTRVGLQSVLDALGHNAPPEPHGDAISGSAELLREMLQDLAFQLRDSDMAATDTIAAMRQKFDSDTLAQLQPLEDAVNALEFDSALSLCNSWLETHTS